MIFQYKKLSQHSIALLFFLFPILSIIVEHWVSLTFLVLILGGMAFGLKSWASLKPYEKNLFIGFSLFCGFIALSLFEVDDIRDGFRYFEKYTSFIFVIFAYLFLKRLNFNFAKYFILGCTVAPVVWLIYYYVTTSATSGRPHWAYYAIFIGDFAVLIASLSIVYLVTLADSTLKKTISWIVFLLATVLAILSETRGGWLYYPILLIVLYFMYRKKILLNLRAMNLVVLLIILLGTLFASSLTVKDRMAQTLEDYKQYQFGEVNYTSVGVRLDMWIDSIRLFTKSPLTGIGISNFKKHRKALERKGRLVPYGEFGHAHSIYFNTLATTGLFGFLGLLFYVFLLPFKFFMRVWRETDSAEIKFYSLSGIVLITSFMVFGLTESWLSRNPFVRTYLIMMVLLMSSIMFELKKSELEKES